MLRGSREFEQAILGPYSAKVKAEAWLGGRRIETDLPLVAGSINGDGSRFVRRSASLEFADETGASMRALSKTLAQPGCEVRVWRGVTVAGTDWWLPVHWGLAENPTRTLRDKRVSLTSPDRSMRVAYYRFPKPRATSAGFTVAQQISAFVKEAMGASVKFDDQSFDSTAVTPVVFDRDRNDAITKLAKSIGCETFWRPDGTWVLRRVSGVIGTPSLRVLEGVNLADASEETDWDSVRNWWVVSSDRADGTALFGEAKDDDPESPTYYAGPMGVRTGYYSSSLFTTNAQCENTARTLLYQSQGARVSVDYSTLLHPGVEAGDRHDVSFGGESYRLILDSFSFDLFSASMTGRARAAYSIPEES